MIERKQHLATVISALLLVVAVVLVVIGVQVVTINFIKAIALGILSLWIIAKAL